MIRSIPVGSRPALPLIGFKKVAIATPNVQLGITFE